MTAKWRKMTEDALTALRRTAMANDVRDAARRSAENGPDYTDAWAFRHYAELVHEHSEKIFRAKLRALRTADFDDRPSPDQATRFVIDQGGSAEGDFEIINALTGRDEKRSDVSDSDVSDSEPMTIVVQDSESELGKTRLSKSGEDRVRKVLSVLIELAGTQARENGFGSSSVSLPERLCLVHSEISEALEAYRDPTFAPYAIWEVEGKPEGVAVELADALLRIFDLAFAHDLDLASAFIRKSAYNVARSHRHGGKRI